jgi:hypothetical protein
MEAGTERSEKNRTMRIPGVRTRRKAEKDWKTEK